MTSSHPPAERRDLVQPRRVHRAADPHLRADGHGTAPERAPVGTGTAVRAAPEEDA